jgi:hypothetical protein
MKFANAGKLDRKSGVRFGEPGAPVLLPVFLVRPKGKLQIPPLRFAPVGMTKAALTVAMGRVSMKIGDQQNCTSGGRDSAGDDRVSQAIS